MIQAPANSFPEYPDRATGERVVLVGASIRSAAQSARKAGFSVIGVDRFGDQDTQAACDHIHVIDAPGPNDAGQGNTKQWDDVLGHYPQTPMFQVGGIDGRSLVLDRLMNHCRLLRDPDMLRRLVADSGIRFPQTTAAPLSRGRMNSGRWLLKKIQRCGGLGVRWFDHYRDRDDDATSFGSSFGEDEFVQQWIAGRGYGATLLSDGTEVRLLGVCRSYFHRRGENPFVYSGSLGPLSFSHACSKLFLPAIERLGEQIIATTQIKGLINIDFLLDRDNQLWLLEVNPHWSSSSELIERSMIDRGSLRGSNTLFSLLHRIQCHAASLRSLEFGNQEDLASTRNVDPPQYYKRVLFARSETRFDDSLEFRETGTGKVQLTCRNSDDDRIKIHDIPRFGTLIKRQEPLCTIVFRMDQGDPESTKRVSRVLRSLRRGES